MVSILNQDPNTILRILTNMDDPNRRFPGPQNAEQLKGRQDYADNLMKNMQLQGNANYVPMNALADSIRGYMGGRYLEKNERAVRNMGERDATAMTRGVFPSWGGHSNAPTITESIRPEGPQIKPTRDNPEIDALIQKAAQEAGVDPSWLKTFVDIESGGNPKAKTGKYVGLLQLSPEEAAQYGGQDADLTNPEVNLTLGAMKIKAESEQFKQKYGRDPSPQDIYLIHQQGQGGFDAHSNNPDAPAWQNMAMTAEGRARGSKWAKEAIWKNVPNDLKKQFGSVDNVTSGQFMQMWGDRVNQRMQRYAQPSADPVRQDMQFDQQATLDPRMIDPAREQSLALKFNQPESIAAGMQSPNTPLLDQNPANIGKQVSQAGAAPLSNEQMLPGPRPEPTIPATGMPGETTMPKTGFGKPTFDQTIPKTTPGIPEPPEGTFRQEAQIPNTHDQFAGTSQTRPTETQMTADAGGDPSNEAMPGEDKLLNVPSSPYSQINPNQLYDILKSPTIPPEIKQQFMQQAQQQGQMQNIPVEGGKVYYNPRTGQQLYVPEPKWGTTSIKGISVPSISIKRKMNGPWESFLMDGTPVPADGGGEGGQSGPTGGSSGGQQQGGIEGLAARGREIERQDKLSSGQADNQTKARSEHMKAGEAAEKAHITIQRLKEFENAPENSDLRYGRLAGPLNEFIKGWNGIMPNKLNFPKEGTVTLTDLYTGIATNLAAQVARQSDPNPSVKQFEAMVSASPSLLNSPNARRALILSMQHQINMDREIGKVARSGKSQEQYSQEVDDIRQRYAEKKVVPDALLKSMKRGDKSLDKLKWIREGEHPDDVVKPGEKFIHSDGRLMERYE